MDSENTYKYAILLRNTKVSLYQSSEIQIKDNGNKDASEKSNDELDVNAGTLIKIFETKQSHTKRIYIIQFLDLVNHVHIYENLYECLPVDLQRVHANLWPFIINIVDPDERLRMVKNCNLRSWLLNLKIDDIVSVAGELVNMKGKRFICVIRYIGPVPELYAVGYFFGLEILESDNVRSLQTDKVNYRDQYNIKQPDLYIFATSNYIYEITNEQEKKCSGGSLFSGTVERIKSAFGPSSSFTGSVSSGTSSLKGDKKNKKSKEPKSCFYDTSTDTTDNCINSNSKNNNNSMERNKRVPLNDKQLIENREKGSERRAATTNTVETQTQPQSGILKIKYKDDKKFDENDPKVLVIDKDDINESIKQQHDIIIVQRNSATESNLVQILGNHWPASAGVVGGILNDSNKINNTHTSANNRNKSSNPLSHITGNSVKNTNDSISSNNKNVQTKKIQKKCDKTDTEEPLYGNTSSNTVHVDAALDRSDYSNFVESDSMQILSLKEVPGTELGLGSVVVVNVTEVNGPLNGVIRWIGMPPDQNNILVGVELDGDCIDKQIKTTDGGYNGISLFKCPAGRGIFVTSDQCSIDKRFMGAVGGEVSNVICDNKSKPYNGLYDEQQTFGNMECPVVPGAVAPPKCSSLDCLEQLCGKFKGIQGHHNSCYLDVTLFSMFAFTPVFDAILYRPPEKDDISHYNEVQTVLREQIVNPLRKNMFVRADRVMKLRELLDRLSSVSGLTSEEKDPEEFLNCLLSQILRAEPFLKLNSGHDAYYYQLFVEKDERLSFPSVQQLFEQSFYMSDIKLKEVPSCLIIQMPRFGKSFKTYSRILPSQVLDVTDIIEDSPRQCSICGKLAEFECRDCFGVLQNGIGLESISFCPICLETVHMHSKRANHAYRELSVPQDFRVMVKNMSVPRLYMELFAVLCIETSHYVAFVKAGSGPDAPWCFFDSMADRKGELNGYNIPEMKTVPDLPQWLSEDGARKVNETFCNDKMFPEHAKRLFCDAYMCMYQSTDVMMYR